MAFKPIYLYPNLRFTIIKHPGSIFHHIYKFSLSPGQNSKLRFIRFIGLNFHSHYDTFFFPGDTLSKHETVHDLLQDMNPHISGWGNN